ncbi:aldo/keto reductase [Asanoa iriomotensis]|uniref:2,5-diketo-D-gluconate reductase A n=1 Tax=Asanoa iriomotensis TaxID=234613 RepID=A0ABQ4BWT6_9ACTN|nr:aldo/keto reductase [Asanoa iriomotensis]GIF54993.1 2,5-diketo-D-gluconate reductase A [Asanoa iriomotensis]
MREIQIAPGVAMPMIGLGTAGLHGSGGERAVRGALDLGYRLIDTATAYGNEQEVGAALRSSGVRAFVTTKLRPEDAGREPAVLAASLRALGVDRIDLWLIHWPVAGGAGVPSWQAMLAARDEGLVRAVGVSNYSPSQVDSLIAATGEAPAVNQIPWSPALHSPSLLAAFASRGVVVEGYSPLRRTALDHPALRAVAAAHGVPVSEVVIAWHLAHDVVAIPRSADPSRQRSNLAAASLNLSPDEIAAIDAIGP